MKSRKYEWEEACFVPDLADTDRLCAVVSRFVELQDGAPTGGIVLRRYEEFVRDARGRAEESRVWWVDGEPVLRGAHPDAPPGRPRTRTCRWWGRWCTRWAAGS
ncbi:ATP-grasp domain-containing protein [Kitasatospora arboriphila]